MGYPCSVVGAYEDGRLDFTLVVDVPVMTVCPCSLAISDMLSASTGDFRRFERFSLILVAGSLLLLPILVMIHPPMGQVAHDFLIPQLPAGGKLADVMLMIIGIIGTTVAPWQLFFQQSYVIDKRITPRFIQYQRADLWLGIVLVVIGAVAMIAFTAQVFNGHAIRPLFT